jgi:Outer membrane protein beta-barrel domain
MLNVPRLFCVRSVLFCLLLTAVGSTAKAQTSQNTGLDRQLSRIDLGVSAVGVFNMDSNGVAVVNGKPNTPVNLSPGQTAGAVVTLRYTIKPMVGFEGNYGYARYTDTFTPFGAQPNGGVQQNASEYTLGYVVHAKKEYFGMTPFASGGLGTMVFRPTPGGGLALPEQARAVYYFSVGAETTVWSPHFGVRLQYRQLFFKAPDFETNYLTIQQHTTTFEPGFGFFLRF